MKSLQQSVLRFINEGIIEDVSIEDIISSLQICDALYAGEVDGEESPITDIQYDALRLYASKLNPTHSYFIGVGSEIRGGKINLPHKMGSLNQIEIGDIEEWVSSNVLSNEDHVVSDKMDGTSALLIYDADGKPQIAYSRGDGIQGADISRHIFKIKNVPATIPYISHTGLSVRAEVELTETAFQALYNAGIRRRGGEPYKNSRNMVAGLMNSKTIPQICYQYLTVVCYEVLNLNASKQSQLRLLSSNGFQTVQYSILKGHELTDALLAKILADRKSNLDYQIDGLVIEVDSIVKRTHMNSTKDTLNPEYAIKYKVADVDNYAETSVVEVEWNLSKHGYLKPRLILDPVQLVGVTVTHATGYNAKYIKDNNIGAGTIVAVSRKGDVIPNVIKVIKPTIANMPQNIVWSWNDTGVDALIDNYQANTEVSIQQTLDFFTSIAAPHLKEGTIRKLFALYRYTDASSAISKMLNYSLPEWMNDIGENGNKIYKGLYAKLTIIPLYVLMGSLPFFGRGVGKRKFKKLEQSIGTDELQQLNQASRPAMLMVDGFRETTVDKILAGMKDYLAFYPSLPTFCTIGNMTANTSGQFNGMKICFTGFRNSSLQQSVEEQGGEITSTVSGNTSFVVAKIPDGNSGKLKTARTKNIKVISIPDLEGML